MNMQNSVKRRSTRMLLPLLSAVLVAAGPAVWASPPKRPHVPEPLEKVGDFFYKLSRTLERLGVTAEDGDLEFTYDARRRQPLSVEVVPAPPPEETPHTGIVVPPGYRGGYYGPGPTARPYPRRESEVPPGYQPYREPFIPPRFQPNPQPRLQNPNLDRREEPEVDGRVSPDSNAPLEDTRPGTRRAPGAANGAPFDPPTTPAAKTRTEKSEGDITTDRPTPKADAGELGVATPVPGHNGFVYPPGVEHDLKNMLDVRDFSPGQKVKDPRTGRMFLVPAK